MTTEWQPPRPNVGDIVLYSRDYEHFSKPTVGFVINEPGATTISILTFTPSGYAMVYNSCHHRDDPAVKQANGWRDLGVWDFAPLTKTIRELTAEPTSARKSAK